MEGADQMEAAALARRARAVDVIRRLSKVAESDGTPAERRPSTVAESDGTPAAAEQECNHFSIRGYVAELQKKDPKLCSPHIFYSQPQYDERHDSSPVLVSKQYRRWDCSKCVDRMKVSGHRPTSEDVSMEQAIQNVDPPYPLARIILLPDRGCLEQYHANAQLE